MKYKIDNVIVVEGRADEAYLSSFIDAVFVVTNGYDIPLQEIQFLNNPKLTKPIIVLTDSDKAGEEIRSRLNSILVNSINIYVDILKCNKNGKHGVAECDKQEVINVLKEHFTDSYPSKTISSSDLMNLDINKQTRDQICRDLSLGICNNKTFIKRLNCLCIKKEDLKHYGNK